MSHEQDDGDIEELKAADAKEVHRAVREEGEAELERPVISLLWSALAAGFAINASLFVEGALDAKLPQAPWRELVIALGYPIGFLIVILGRMQFFTESTITAMLPLTTKPSWWAARRTARLWLLVLAANFVGTAIVMLTVAGTQLIDPDVRNGMIAVSSAILEHDAGATFMTAVPAGFMIASIAWVLPNAREQAFLVIFAITYAVGAAGFSHSVVGSAEAFLLLFAGRTDGMHAIFALILPAVAGNLVGGAGLFAVLAHGQVRGELRERAKGK